MNSKMNVAYSYSWLLPFCEIAQVRAIIESLRQHAIELGSEAVGPVVMLTDEAAQAVRSDFDHVIVFSATIPNARGESDTQQFGLGFSPEKKGWSFSGVVRASSFREISALMVHAASLGIFVSTTFAGMILGYHKNAEGEIEVEQRPAFDWTDF